MHTDEAVNAYIVGQLLAGETFHYDPRDRHGPALAALALPLARMQGARSFSDLTETELRLTSVVAGTTTILLFGAAAEMFGFTPCLLGAALFAFAPLPVYFDRYFIHESLFCAATFGLILSGWHALKTGSDIYAAAAGACAALMLACKETAVLHFFAMAVPGSVLFLLYRRRQTASRSLRVRQLVIAVATFLILGIVLFSWFGRSWDSLRAVTKIVPNVIARAAGQGHEQPFWYYGKLLTGGWSGGVLVGLACAGLFVALKKRESLSYQFLALYGLLIAVMYSLIPYKTPWLGLNLWLPLAILAGLAMDFLWRSVAERFGRLSGPGFSALAVIVALLIAHDTRQRVFLRPADEVNPYAYAHTSDDILELPDEISDMAARDGMSTPRIAVIASDPWPLPWYLRHFSQVGFWQPGQQVPNADFYITSAEAANQYGDRLRGFRPDFFGSRPGVLILLWLPEPK